MMAGSPVRLERHDGFALLTLNRDAWQRVTDRALGALARLCDDLRDDDGVQAVVLTGESDAFCGDWSESLDLDASALAGAFTPLADLPQPVIAAVNGPALGAGMELALAADVRLAAAGAHFRLAAAGAMPRAGGLTRLTRAAGRATATWIALSGETLSAPEALAAHLVSAVLPPERLLPEAERIATVVASRGPIAVRFAKEAFRYGPEMTLAQALRFETDLTILLQTTADRAEGVAAFTEKREPNFRGQ